MKGQKLGDYIVGEEIGVGSFGAVYEGTHFPTDQPVAIKIDITQKNKRSKAGEFGNIKNKAECQELDSETENAEATENSQKVNFFAKSSLHVNLSRAEKPPSNSQLKNENKAYTDLKGIKGVIQNTFYGTQDGIEFLVMPKLYKNLGQIKQGAPPVLTEASVAVLGAILVEILEGIHSRGRIYRDMKPENIMIDHNNNVFLVDFGLCKYYIDCATKKHIHFSAGNDLCGTARYASVFMHEGHEQSRRDDLISLFYVLIFLSTGNLPWAGACKATGKETYNFIGGCKREINVRSLCKKIPNGKNFVLFYEHVFNLGFEETPDYLLLKKLMEKCVEDRKSGWLVAEYFSKRVRRTWVDSIVDFFVL